MSLFDEKEKWISRNIDKLSLNKDFNVTYGLIKQLRKQRIDLIKLRQAHFFAKTDEAMTNYKYGAEWARDMLWSKNSILSLKHELKEKVRLIEEEMRTSKEKLESIESQLNSLLTFLTYETK